MVRSAPLWCWAHNCAAHGTIRSRFSARRPAGYAAAQCSQCPPPLPAAERFRFLSRHFAHSCRGCTGGFAFAGNKIHQIVHMHHVAAGKYTGDLGFHIFIYHGPLGVGVHGNTCLAGQLVFGDQPTLSRMVSTSNSISVPGIGRRFSSTLQRWLFPLAFCPEFPQWCGISTAEYQNPASTAQCCGSTRRNKASLPRRRALWLPPASYGAHDQADIAASQNQYPSAHQVAFHIYIALGCTGGINSRRAGAGGADSPAGALAAAHAQDNAFGLNDLVALLRLTQCTCLSGVTSSTWCPVPPARRLCAASRYSARRIPGR